MLAFNTADFRSLVSHPYAPKIALAISGFIFILSLTHVISLQTNKVENNTGEVAITTKVIPSASDIVNFHLFGIATADNYDTIVKTQLPFILQGVMVKEPIAEQTALISNGGAPAKVYRIGDSIDGKATLVEILNDGVILNRNGQLERLMLRPKKD